MIFGDNIEAIHTDRIAYENKRKSNLILWLMTNLSLERKDIAELICPKYSGVYYLNNKLQQDSFSIEDIMAICAAENLQLYFVKNDGSPLGRIDPYEWLSGYKDDLVCNIDKFNKAKENPEYKKYLSCKMFVEEYEKMFEKETMNEDN